MKNQKKKGFTLIELLVVIAIIGLLATLSVVALNNARERARDSRRVSDIRQIQTALELYYNANNNYPAQATADDANTALGGLSSYLNPVPQNPSPDDCGVAWSEEYQYQSAGASSYTIQYCLGNDTGGISSGLNTASEMSIQ